MRERESKHYEKKSDDNCKSRRERERENETGKVKKKVREMINLALPTGQVKTKDFPFHCKSAFAPFPPTSPFLFLLPYPYLHSPPTPFAQFAIHCFKKLNLCFLKPV